VNLEDRCQSWRFRYFDNFPLCASENVARSRDGRRMHRSERSRRNVGARHDWRRWSRGCRLPKRFQEFANAFFIRFDRRSSGSLSQLRAGRRSLIWVLQCFLCFAGFACEQSKQRSHRDQQNEKEIIEVHGEIVKSLKRLHRYNGSPFNLLTVSRCRQLIRA